MARPTKYKAEYCSQVYKLCLLNATDAQIGGVFEVDESTINNWKKEYPQFLESIKKGKLKADADVAKSLHARAVGYSHPEDKIFCTNGVVTTVKTIKHYPPDTAAAFIWLKNRAGWTDKQETEHTLSKATATLLGLIDGSSKGKLPDPEEAEDNLYCKNPTNCEACSIYKKRKGKPCPRKKELPDKGEEDG